MKYRKAAGFTFLAMGVVGVFLSVRGQTGSALVTVGTRETRFVFPLNRGGPLPPPPLPPPPPPPPDPSRVVRPSAPRDLRIGSRNAQEITLAWLPGQAAPGHGVIRYEIFRNGTKVDESQGTMAVQRYGSANSMVEFFSVRAVDDQEARSALSNEVMAPRLSGPGELFFQAKTAFGRREVGGFPGLIEGGETFRKRVYSYRLHRVDSASGSVLDKTESIVQIFDLDSGVMHNESKLIWTGTGLYADSALSIDVEGEESDPDFPGVVLDASRLAVLFNNQDRTNTHSRVEAAGSPDFSEVSEITYSLPISAEDEQGGVESDFLQAQAQLDFLGWGETYGVSRGQPVEGGGLPLAARGLGEMSASDYRLGVPAGGLWHVRWAEVFLPSDGGASEILAMKDEIVDGTSGPGFTAIHRAPLPNRPGVTTIILVNGLAEAVPAPSAGPRMFVPNAIFAGQSAQLAFAETTFAPGGNLGSEVGSGGPGPVGPPAGGGGFSLPAPYRFTSIVVTIDDPANAVRLFAIDPAVEASAGLAEALARGRAVASGTNLASLELPGGMGYGEWQLIALGQGAGSAALSLEYENSPATRLTTTLRVLPAVELAVDANRNHRISLPSEGDADATTADAPFQFWLNDDIDRGHVVDDVDHEEDDIGPAEAAANHWTEDWKSNFIPCARDLEDFARLSLATGGWERDLKAGEVLLGLKWTEASGSPAIKLYAQAEPGGGTAYLTDSFLAGRQMLEPALLDVRGLNDDLRSPTARTIAGSGEVFILPPDFWQENVSMHSFLFEGCMAGKGRLQPVLLRPEGGDYVEIGEMPGVWLDLRKIAGMYEHWSVGNGNGVAPAGSATRIAAETSDGQVFHYASDAPEERSYVLDVHGWNMEKWEKERYAETAYKRLYWQGYRGRFGLFSWPAAFGFQTDLDAILDSTNFDRGEFTAWRSAAPLRQLLQDLAASYDGQTYVFSHSTGAVVVSEALRLQSDARGPQIAKVYVAGQAALSAHVYDGSLADTPGSVDALQWHYTHPRLRIAGDYGPGTPDVYRNWAAFVVTGSAVSTASVGRVVNFYNENDYALAAPVWQFNQITKPDFADFPEWLWEYRYEGDPAEAPSAAGFRKFGKFTNITGEITLHLGTRAEPADRYEIMAFAAESRVKALGATADVHHGISGAVNLRSVWPADNEEHKTHRWHSAAFRSTIQIQKDFWKVLLRDDGFDISTVLLP